MFQIILLILMVVSCSNSNYVGTMQIRDFVLNKCTNSGNDPISVNNFTIEFGNHLVPIVSGTFSTSVDLNSPIEVSIDVKRKVIFWIEVPCVDNLGSCTYKDVCIFGIAKNKPCPPILNDNKVPCRCPIKKGTYIIPESIGSFLENTAIYSGYYKGNVIIKNDKQRLGCYDMTFELYNS
nr:ganglioside GM2 activator-like [Onthophagus taurus]